METNPKATPRAAILAILIWGGLWGIFEATAGYLLHLLPFSVGWLVWYPVACFFMYNVYRATGRTGAVAWVGLLAAGVKLLNLWLPGSIDRVLNPAVSILLEALAMAAAAEGLRRLPEAKRRALWARGLAIVAMNTGWRALYALYLLFLVPGWMREVSVIATPEKLTTFFLTHNLGTGLVLLAGALGMGLILRPILAAEARLSAALSARPARVAAGIKIAAAASLTAGSIALGMLL